MMPAPTSAMRGDEELPDAVVKPEEEVVGMVGFL
jgi:hypothetical protein